MSALDDKSRSNIHCIVTPPEAALLYYVCQHAVTQAARKGKLNARWAGAAWLIDRYSLYQRWGDGWRDRAVPEQFPADVHAVLLSGEVCALYGISRATIDHARERRGLIVRRSAGQWLIDAESARQIWGGR